MRFLLATVAKPTGIISMSHNPMLSRYLTFQRRASYVDTSPLNFLIGSLNCCRYRLITNHIESDLSLNTILQTIQVRLFFGRFCHAPFAIWTNFLRTSKAVLETCVDYVNLPGRTHSKGRRLKRLTIRSHFHSIGDVMVLNTGWDRS